MKSIFPSVFLTLFALLFLSEIDALQAQENKTGGRPGGRERPAIASIQGKVIDSNTKQAIEFATISLLSKKDSSIETGGITNRKGLFNITEIRVGKYLVMVNFIGYEAKTFEDIHLSPRETISMDFGTIELVPSINELKDAEVVVEKPFVEFEIDKKVYNVDENITAEGGDITEVMENLPSIEIDIEGNLSLRGSENVTLLIDGKPSGLSGEDRAAFLEQIPASSVEKIEVITNPSAKYDPDGMAGIINVVLKKNKLAGFHGNVKLSIGTGDKYNGSISLNYRNQFFSVYSGFSYRYDRRYSEGLIERTNIIDDVTSSLNQENEGFRLGKSPRVNLGTDIYLNTKNTLSISGSYNQRNNIKESEVWNQYLAPVDSTDNYLRQSDGESSSTVSNLSASYRKEFKNRDHYLTIEGSHFNFNNTNKNTFEEHYLDANMNSLSLDPKLEYQETTGLTQSNTVQADFALPMKKGSKLEVGWKSILRESDSDLYYKALNDSSGNFENDITRSNHFVSEEQIHAAYSTFGMQREKLGIQLGLRYENALTNSELITSNETFKNTYQSFFPSAHLSYSITEKSDLQLSYSRRIHRPRSRQLNPFPNYSDPQNLRKGNPFLLPEYINSLELSMIKQSKKGSISASVYYKGISDVIRRFKTVDTNGVATMTYENIDDAQSYGLELFTMIKLTKFWNINASGNVYQTVSDAGNLESDFNSNTFAWNMKMTNTFKFDQGWNIQISAKYRSPKTILQGDIKAMYYADLAIKKSILKDKGSLNLRVSDIFNTRRFKYHSEGFNFEQNDYHKRESQIVYLSFSYRFGKLEEKKSRRSGSGRETEGDSFDEMDL